MNRDDWRIPVMFFGSGLILIGAAMALAGARYAQPFAWVGLMFNQVAVMFALMRFEAKRNGI